MEHLKKDETPKAEKKRRWPVVLLIILIIITIILGGSALAIYLSTGDMTPEQTPTIADAEPAERDSEVLDSYTVRYNDKLYRYNDQIVTLLLLGVDRDTPNVTEGSVDSDVYADVVLLAAIDMKNNKVSFYTISRDTMCGFTIPDTETGGTVNVNGQLALTFSYGDGGKTSCEMTKNAVSQLLFDLPIYSCSALYLKGRGPLNDAGGGVTVTVLEDLSYGYASMQPGAEVTLDGAMAERYIRARERTEEGNLKRMERQKQFFTALMKKVLASVKERPASILDLYGKISSDVVTDLETGDILYLATEASGMRIDTNIRNVPGTVTSDENGFVQYDLDEAGLLELLVDVYYEAEE